jgi:hypothetical protein
MSTQATKVKISKQNIETVESKVGITTILLADFLDVNSNTAPIDGLPTWIATNPAVLSVTPISGNECEVLAISPGVSEVVCYADADLSAGVRQIAGRINFNVTVQEAQTVVVSVKE